MSQTLCIPAETMLVKVEDATATPAKTMLVNGKDAVAPSSDGSVKPIDGQVQCMHLLLEILIQF